MSAKKKTRGAKKSNGIADLIKELWQAAVNLRGSIEPADYKRYVLPLIFLRFLSLRYERRRAELEALIADPTSDYHNDQACLTDPDEYRSAGAFIVPEDARWESIRSAAQRDDIKIHLDAVLETMERAYPERLRGLLPRIYAGSNLDAENVRGLINLFSKDIFKDDHGGEDLVGRVYEYFIGEFASSEGKRGGEYFTPASIVRLLVSMLEPERGTVFDPCCGAGGMFVQSDLFTKHNRRLSFYGQESKDFTHRLCRMNLFIHGIDGRIEIGNSYTNDQHAELRADYILANPPFNDGSKGEQGWGADKVPDGDPRLSLAGGRLPLAPRNANTMWMLHFLHHLADDGTAGFVMASGELSNAEIARLEVRKTIVEAGYVDCIVQLPGKLFANTQIPCSLWFLSKGRQGSESCRARKDEVLFIDGRKLGTLIPGSRKQKQFSEDEIAAVAAVYHEFRHTRAPEPVAGSFAVASIDDIRAHQYALNPGRYVGNEDPPEGDEPFDDLYPRLVSELTTQFDESTKLQRVIEAVLPEVPENA